jgi:tetratricopeptide (TPR) repeat protein
LAYSALADAYSVQAAMGFMPPGERHLKAKAAAEKALELDDSLFQSHMSLAHLKWLTWDWDGADKAFLRAAEFNAPYPAAYLWYALYLSSLGRHQEALAIVKTGQERNPASIPVNGCALTVHFFARQYDEAIAAGLKNLELEPNDLSTLYFLAMAYEQKGMYDEAVATQLKELLARGAKPEEVEASRAVYNASGWRGYWLKRTERLTEAAKRRYVSPFDLAQMYIHIGDKERAFAFLENAYSERSDQLTRLKVDPTFDPLRSDPRYTHLMRRVGFPD